MPVISNWNPATFVSLDITISMLDPLTFPKPKTISSEGGGSDSAQPPTASKGTPPIPEITVLTMHTSPPVNENETSVKSAVPAGIVPPVNENPNSVVPE